VLYAAGVVGSIMATASGVGLYLRHIYRRGVAPFDVFLFIICLITTVMTAFATIQYVARNEGFSL
jgi:hypothetical protein